MAFDIPTSSEIVTKSMQTLKRFPLTIITSLIVAVILIYLIEIDSKDMKDTYLTLSKIALSGSLAVFVFTAIRLFGESLSLRLHQALTIIAVLSILAYYFTLPDSSEEFSTSIIRFRHFFLSLLFFIAFLWAPFIRTNLNDVDYWEYAKEILFAFTTASLFTLVIILGINSALFAVEKLFDLDISSDRYFQIDIFIIAIFSVGYFLSQIPLKPQESKQSQKNQKVEKFFTKWLLTPLSGLYFFILYAYTIKVIITFDLPKGLLAWLIVAFSMVAILTYLFWTHFAKEQEGKYRRWIWLAVLLQTVMLFVAIWIRISEYSWTESRYMVFVLGLWLAGISLYFLLFKSAKIKWIFISLSALIAITQVGPLSAYSISKNAQMSRLSGMVIELKKHKDPSKAPLKLRYEASDVLRYLNNRYRGEALVIIFPKLSKEFRVLEVKRQENLKLIKNTKNKDLPIPSKLTEINNELRKEPSSLPSYITNKLGFKILSKWKYRKLKSGKQQDFGFSMNRYSLAKMKNIQEYDYMSMVHFNLNEYEYEYEKRKKVIKTQRIYFNDPSVTLIYSKKHQFTISKDNLKITVDVENFMNNLIDKYGEFFKDLDSKELTIKKQNNHFKIKLELKNINKKFYDGNKTIDFNGVLFIKL